MVAESTKRLLESNFVPLLLNPSISRFLTCSPEVFMEQERDVLAVKDARKFEVHCNAGDAGELCVGTESLSVKVGQRIHRDGVEKIWHSLLIYGVVAEHGMVDSL